MRLRPTFSRTVIAPMVIMAFNQQSKVLDGIGYRNLALDAEHQRRGNRPPN